MQHGAMMHGMAQQTPHGATWHNGRASSNQPPLPQSLAASNQHIAAAGVAQSLIGCLGAAIGMAANQLPHEVSRPLIASLVTCISHAGTLHQYTNNMLTTSPGPGRPHPHSAAQHSTAPRAPPPPPPGRGQPSTQPQQPPPPPPPMQQQKQQTQQQQQQPQYIPPHLRPPPQAPAEGAKQQRGGGAASSGRETDDYGSFDRTKLQRHCHDLGVVTGKAAHVAAQLIRAELDLAELDPSATVELCAALMVSLAMQDSAVRSQLLTEKGVKTVDPATLRQLASRAMAWHTGTARAAAAAQAEAATKAAARAAAGATTQAAAQAEAEAATRAAAAAGASGGATEQHNVGIMEVEDVACLTCGLRTEHRMNQILLCDWPGCGKGQHKVCAGLRCLPRKNEPFYCTGCAGAAGASSGQRATAAAAQRQRHHSQAARRAQPYWIPPTGHYTNNVNTAGLPGQAQAPHGHPSMAHGRAMAGYHQ